MADLILDNKIIITPIKQILDVLRKETGYRYFKHMEDKGDNIRVTCPSHKNGQENHPSADIYCGDSPDVEYGFLNCFTCGARFSLPQLVEYCFNEKPGFGKEWLIERFGDTFFEKEFLLADIELPSSKPIKEEQVKILDESILEQYNYYHDYMWKRGLAQDVVDKFKVGFNPKTQSLTFPVWDHKGNLVMITERSVHSKRFHIPEDVEKPIYLLNFMLQESKDTLYICESQINCLTLQGWGYPAVGLFGTGSANQFKLLNSLTNIREYYLVFDGDQAGDNATQKFIKNIRKDVLINIVKIPRGKDVNDLTKKEFEQLEIL